MFRRRDLDTDSKVPVKRRAIMASPARQHHEASPMPVVHRFEPYRFFFYSNENRAIGEPPHIHVVSAQGSASFWLSPVSLREAWGYTPREVHRIRRLVIAHREEILRRWHEHFDT